MVATHPNVPILCRLEPPLWCRTVLLLHPPFLPSKKKKNIMANSYLVRRSFNSNPELGTLLFSHQQWHEPLILFSLSRRHGLLLLQVLNGSILFHYHLKEIRKCIPLNKNRNGCLGRALCHNELNLLEPKDSDVQNWAVFKKITFSDSCQGLHRILSQLFFFFFHLRHLKGLIAI